MKCVFILVLFLFQILGVWFASYGLLRESFSRLATDTGVFSREAFDPKAFDVTGNAWWQEKLVDIGYWSGLLPKERTLNVQKSEQEFKKNASYAILGVALLGLSVIIDTIGKLFSS